MKKGIFLVLIALLVGWMGFMSYLNQMTTTVHIRVQASVDQVTIFRLGSEQPVAWIVTNGQDQQAQLQLANTTDHALLWQGQPAQYYFISSAGGEQFRGDSFCCSVSLAAQARQLEIRGLNNWEVTTLAFQNWGNQ